MLHISIMPSHSSSDNSIWILNGNQYFLWLVYLEYRDRQSRNWSNKGWGWSQRGVDTVKRWMKKIKGNQINLSSVYCSSASEFGKVYESHYFKLEFSFSLCRKVHALVWNIITQSQNSFKFRLTSKRKVWTWVYLYSLSSSFRFWKNFFIGLPKWRINEKMRILLQNSPSIFEVSHLK